MGANLLKDIERRRSLERIRGKAKRSAESRQLALFGNGNGNGSKRRDGGSPQALRAELEVLARALPLQALERAGDDPLEALLGYLENGGRADMWEAQWFASQRQRDHARQRAEGAMTQLRKIADRYSLSVLELLDDSGIDVEQWFRKSRPDPWNSPRYGGPQSEGEVYATATVKREAKKPARGATLRGHARAMVAVLRNAYQDGDHPAHFGSKRDKAALRALVKKGLATIVRQEPKGPEGPQLWAKFTPLGAKLYGKD